MLITFLSSSLNQVRGQGGRHSWLCDLLQRSGAHLSDAPHGEGSTAGAPSVAARTRQWGLCSGKRRQWRRPVERRGGGTVQSRPGEAGGCGEAAACATGHLSAGGLWPAALQCGEPVAVSTGARPVGSEQQRWRTEWGGVGRLVQALPRRRRWQRRCQLSALSTDCAENSGCDWAAVVACLCVIVCVAVAWLIGVFPHSLCFSLCPFSLSFDFFYTFHNNFMTNFR